MNETMREAIEGATGLRIGASSERPVGGGCINETSVLVVNGGEEKFFVKRNSAAKAAMFEAEMLALVEIGDTGTIRVPRPVCRGQDEGEAFLVLEYIELQRNGDEVEMGRRLASLHRACSPDGRFGWHRDNTIGETPQSNAWSASWAEFFARERIGPQLKMAAARGRSFRNGELLLERIPALLAGYRPAASLLHGDLWGGNAAYDQHGSPVVFDPATYYGDRETDLAFTEMFGGFGSRFYAAYENEFPFAEGVETRKRLYNLYHLLNHFNLFGGGYGNSAEKTIDSLVSL